MFNPMSMGSSSNLHYQLLQREMSLQSQGNPKAFASHLFRERYRLAKNLYKMDLRAHYGCVNAIEFSHGGKYLASGGDDKRVLIWNIETAISGRQQPRVLSTEHTSNIFCLGFDRANQKVYSGGNDDLVVVHDFETGKLVNIFKHDNPVYGLSIDPQCDGVFATACEDGQILIFDQRTDPGDPFVLANLRTSFHAVEFHPAGGNFLVSANSKLGAAFWDIRKPHHPVILYGGKMEEPSSCMSVRFNSTGNLILALRRRLPPILYNTQSPEPVCTFYHGNYYNSCTMKSCTFAGEDDEFVLSGSDDFNLYAWRVSDVDLERTDQWIENAQIVLYGHRSIVNQVRYNRQKCLLASSGVEKIVKLWSPFAQPGWTGSLLDEASCSDNPRELYSPYNFSSMSTPPHSWSHMSHDYSSCNTNEDPRMMAFFDSLIQQEIEGWETSSSTESPFISDNSRSGSSSNNSSESSMEDDDEDDDDDDDNDNGGELEHNGRRAKRLLVKKRDRRRSRSILKKVKLQRHKYANRIAYLIATKRNTLRRLAIKGASLSNRRPYKVIKVGRNTKKIVHSLSNKRPVHRSSSSRSASGPPESPLSAIPSTSAAANALQITGHRFARRKYNKQRRVYDTSSDEDREFGNPVASSTNRYNRLCNSSIPSTSTGITSSLKDDIIQLRRQQQHADSDEDDDDDDEEDLSALGLRSSLQSGDGTLGSLLQRDKKVNGAREAKMVNVEVDADGDGDGEGEGRDESQEQQSTGALSASISESTTSATSTMTSLTTITTLPQSGSENSSTNNSGPSNAHRALGRTELINIDNCSSHSNSRLSNSSYQDDDMLHSSSSNDGVTNAGDRNADRYESCSTPLKRRKMTVMSEYISRRSDLADVNVDVEENNNEQNNNNVFSANLQNGGRPRVPDADHHNTTDMTNEIPVGATDGHTNNAGEIVQHSTPARASMDRHRHQIGISVGDGNGNGNGSVDGDGDDHSPNGHQMTKLSNGAHCMPPALSDNMTAMMTTTNSSSSSILHTPDSGISMTTTVTTPSLRCLSDNSMQCYNEENARDCGEASSGAMKTCSLFQQRVARVRRNYRKRFAEDSESD